MSERSALYKLMEELTRNLTEHMSFTTSTYDEGFADGLDLAIQLADKHVNYYDRSNDD